MKKEIDSLELEIKHFPLTNLKQSSIRNLKISARALQFAAPYIVTAGLTAGLFSFFDATPFYNGDETRSYAQVKTEMNSEGDVSYQKQYEFFDNSEGQLRYYTKWKKEDNGYYSRIVQTYSLDKKSFEDVKKLFDQKNKTLEDILGEPTSNVIETKNNLSEKEIKKEAILKAVIYNEDKDDYIIKKETVVENVFATLLYLLITVFAELLPIYIREEYSSFNFFTCFSRLKEEYAKKDIQQLKKKLEIKKENYERLMR